MTNTATRLLTLILLLQRRPNQKAADLAETLGVSVRSVHRYMEMLDEMGIPIYTERGPYGGFSLVRGYRMPPLIFTPEEAVAVSLGTGLAADLFGSLYREAARAALAKLDNVLPDEQRREAAWARRALVTVGLHRLDLEKLGPILETLRAAVRERCRVSMLYQSLGSSRPTRRELDPYALVFRWGWWYVAGFCHLRQGVRLFRVDRILELAVLEHTFPLPEFDARAYLDQLMQQQPLLKVKLRFDPGFAFLARENFSAWEGLKELPGGAVEVCLSVPDAAWGASTALAYGPAVTVIEPEEVRKTVAEWARETMRKYEEGKG